MQRCFFFFTQRSVGTALAELREIRGEKIQKIVEFFALILMCPWCVNECKSKYVYFFFFSWKYRMLQFYKMTVEWNRADDIAYSISFPLFLWPSKLPYVLFKRFNTFTLIHTNLVYFCPSSCIRTEPPVVPFGQFWFHLVLCMSFCGEAASWPGCGVPVKLRPGIWA